MEDHTSHFSNSSSRSAVAGGGDNATTVMSNRQSTSRLMDLYLSQMPISLMSYTMLMRNRDTGSNSTDSSSVAVPPPPPIPTTTDRKKGLRSIFRKQDPFQDEEQPQDNTDHPRGAWIIEQKDSVESVDSSEWPSHWNSFFGGTCRTRNDGTGTTSSSMCRRSRRLLLVGVASLFIVCGMVGLSMGVTNKNQPTARSSDLAAADGEETLIPSTPSPSSVVELPPPIPDPPASGEVPPPPIPDPPASGEVPPPPIPGPTPENPIPGPCQDSVQVDQLCYTVLDIETIPYTTSFTTCEPHPENWIGIFPAGANPASLPDPLLWLWTCNSQNITDCGGEGVPSGILGIGGVLDPGFYQAALVARDGIAPFSASVVSDAFQVTEICEG
jgi:hypothetical protein